MSQEDGRSRHLSRRFTTIEGWHEVREGVYTLGQRSLTLTLAHQFDADQYNGDLTPFAALNEVETCDSGRHASIRHEDLSFEKKKITDLRSPPGLERPYHIYSSKQKWAVVVLVGVAGLFSGLSSNIYFPALDLIAKDLHVGSQDVNLTITSYLIIQGIAPLIWGSLSDKIGRRPTYIYSFLVYIIANIVLSFSPTFLVLLLFRGLQAAGSASTVSIGNGVIQDITTGAERGGFMSFYQAIRNFSIAAGPVFGGVFAHFLGFRSIFIFLLVLSTITVLAITIYLPETLRSIAGDGSRCLSGIHQPLIRRFRKESDHVEDGDQSSYVRSPVVLRTFIEPLLLLTRLDIVLNLIFGGLIYTIWSMVTSSTTTLFQQLFSLNELQLGFAFIPNGLGTIAGSVVIGILMDKSYKQTATRYRIQHDMPADQEFSTKSLPADFPIERARLKHIPWITALFITSTTAYGFSLDSKTLTGLPGWIAVPLILQFIIAATSNAVFAINQTLVSDLCPGKGASSTAVNNLVRCSMGALGVALVDKMIISVGVASAFTGLGLMTIALCPLFVLQWYWAKDWRLERTQGK